MRFPKAIKNSTHFYRVFRVLVFLILLVMLYFRLDDTSAWDHFSFQFEYFPFLIFILLIPINWGLEAIKFQLVVRTLGISINRKSFRQAFAAGIVIGILTPNMLGNFLGRAYYFQRKDRAAVSMLTTWANHAQFTCSMLAGAISLLVLMKMPFKFPATLLIAVSMAIGIGGLLLYFYGERIIELFCKRQKWLRLVRTIRESSGFRWKVLAISAMRHAIFTIQFSLVLSALGLSWDFMHVFWIWQTYFWVTISPSLFLGKLGVRESVSIWVLSAAGLAGGMVVLASLLTWVGNLLIPSLLSVWVMDRKKEYL
jgi:hypothetical protein